VFLESILIIGCGYVGVPLAKAWMRIGHTVYGTTRGAARLELLKGEGIQPVRLDLLKPPFQLPEAELVYFLVSGSQDETLSKGMTHALSALAPRPPQRFIYSSSTGVYGDHQGGWVDEGSERRATHPAGQRLIRTEEILLSEIKTSGFPGIIARLSGIYGPNRIPGRDLVLKGGPMVGDPDAYLNLIHLDDLVHLLVAAGVRGKVGESYLFSDDQPVLRKAYYRFLAERLGVPHFSPIWLPSQERSGNRRALNQKMKETFQLGLKYPSYREGLEALIPQPASETGL
jgi:nucleoside-diphosphate-sugar epimerase